MTNDAPPAAPDDPLRARLHASRATLLRALEGITERDFAAELGESKSIVRVLAELAAAERRDVAAARGIAFDQQLPEKPLAPQAIHDLAGARNQTERLLAEATAGDDGLRALVEAIAEREEAVAARIAGRKAAPPGSPV